jgi:hypothetical protein
MLGFRRLTTMKKYIIAAPLLFLLPIMLTGIAHADDAINPSINPERPGFTNGAATVGKQTVQIEEGITRSSGMTRFGDGGILRFGITGQTELRLGIPSYQGQVYSPTSYGFKTTINPHLGLIVQTSGENPTTTQAALEGEIPLNDIWTLQVDAVRDSRWSSGFNLGRALTPKLGMFIEGYRTDGWHGDGGLTYLLAKDKQVDISAGDHFVSIGYSIRFMR